MNTCAHQNYDGWRAIEERVSDTPVRQFVFGNYLDEVLAMDVDEDADGDCIESGTDSRYYYHQNAIYSVVAITNEDGEIVEAYEYDPYGKHTLIVDGNDGDAIVNFDSNDVRTALGASALGNSFTFTGQKFDPEAGLHYYKNRYYHCGLGRFVSRDDPYYSSVGNLYCYTQNSPVSLVDIFGRQDSRPQKWTWTVDDQGHKPPDIVDDPVRPGKKKMHAGAADIDKWEVSGELVREGWGCARPSFSGEGSAHFWWSTEKDLPSQNQSSFSGTWNSYDHEKRHTEQYECSWNALKSFSEKYEVKMKTDQAECIVKLFEGDIALRYRLSAKLSAILWDLMDYGIPRDGYGSPLWQEASKVQSKINELQEKIDREGKKCLE